MIETVRIRATQNDAKQCARWVEKQRKTETSDEAWLPTTCFHKEGAMLATEARCIPQLFEQAQNLGLIRSQTHFCRICALPVLSHISILTRSKHTTQTGIHWIVKKPHQSNRTRSHGHVHGRRYQYLVTNSPLNLW